MVSSLDAILSDVIKASALQLSQFGFKRSGNILRLILNGNAALVAFQKSRDNTSEKLRFTVNLAVVCGQLLDHDGVSLNKIRDLDGHLRARLGTFLPGHPDKWWEITAATNKDALAREVSMLIYDAAAPFLIRCIETDELLKLWESGKSPGLTEGARVSYLERLKGLLGKGKL